MDDMSGNEFTLNKVESWVREKSMFELPDTKYPVIYGIYGDPRTEVDERIISFHKQYWELTISDLEVSKNNLLKQLEELNHRVYFSSASMLMYAREAFSEAKYSKFKNRVLSWILAISEMKNNDKKLTGYKIINKIDPANWGVEKNILFQSIASANTYRENWVFTYEKLEIVKKLINAKANNIPAYYAPNYADRSGTIINQHGKKEIAFEALWDSENEIKKLSIDETNQRDKRVKHGEKEAIQKYWEKNKDTYLTDEYRFISSNDFNKNKIAKAIRDDGNFNSHPDTIKEHAGLDNY